MVYCDAGTNFGRAATELTAGNLPDDVVALERSYRNVEFRIALPKQHNMIGAVERVIGLIKNSIKPNMKGPEVTMLTSEEFVTWLATITDKVNNRPLVLSAAVGLTLTPNDILHGSSHQYAGAEDSTTSIGLQLQRLKKCIGLFHTSWQTEFSRRSLLVHGDRSNIHPEKGDVVLIKGEAGDRLLLGLVVDLHLDTNGDVYAATVEYRRSPGGRLLRVKRHMSHLGRFMSRSEHELEAVDLNADVTDDLVGPVGQGSGQPLVPDEVEDELFHDCV